HNLTIPHRLEDLYELYLRELEEGSLDRISIIDKVAVRALKDSHSSLPKIPQLTAGENSQEPDSDQESVKTLGSDKGHLFHRDSYRNILPRLICETER
ncbi:hypothetical protein FKM82_029292, partial [Ascaphus truei]